MVTQEPGSSPQVTLIVLVPYIKFPCCVVTFLHRLHSSDQHSSRNVNPRLANNMLLFDKIYS